MGWLELLAWLGAMNRQREGAQPDPHSWRVHDPWFEQSHQAAKQRR